MNNIVLIGFMGSGKTSVGKSLCETFSMEFVDTDAWIEKKEGKSISEIFAQKGEGFFRSLETQCIRDLLSQNLQNCVISVGGGLPVREENRRLLKNLGKVIYLSAQPDTIYARVKNDTTRPLLQGENPRGRIEDLLNGRKKYYEKGADITVNVDHKTIKEIVWQIEKAGREGMK